MQTPDEYANLLRDVRRYVTYGVMDASLWENSTITAQSELDANFPLWAESYKNRDFFDWQSAIYDNSATTQGHQISLSGGNEKTTFRLSYGFQDDKSYYRNSKYAKNTLSSNINHKINNWLSADLTFRYRRIDYDKYPSGMWENIKRMTPFEKPYDANGALKPTIGREAYINALYTYEPGNHVDRNINKNTEMIVGLKAQPLKYLTFSTNFKWADGVNNRNQYLDKYSISRNLGNSLASMQSTITTDYIWNNILTFDKSFDKHHFNATFVHESISSIGEYSRAKSEALPTKENSYYNLSTGNQNIIAESNYSQSTLLS